MNGTDFKKLFATNADGSLLDEQPLEFANIRFNVATMTWRQAAKYTEGGLPRIISREEISKQHGVDVDVIRAWEMANVGPGSVPTADEMLSIGEDGAPMYKDPLRKWKLVYFPDSGIWRRATSHRDEVSREHVAKKSGADLALIEVWENARNSSTRAA